MDTLPTVKVVNAADPAGYMIINEADFVEGVHQLFEPDAKAEKKTRAKADPEPAAPVADAQ